METDFATPAARVDMTVETIPLTLFHPCSHDTDASSRLVDLSLVRCGALSALDVVSATGVDRTGLFVWRGSRDFVQLYERFCQFVVATMAPGATPSCPFDVAVELGAGSGLGTLTVALCTASAFPVTSGGRRRCVATDYWAPSLALLERSAVTTRASLPDGCPCTPIHTHVLDWLHWFTPSTSHTTDNLAALDAIMGFSRAPDTGASLPTACPRVWLYGLDVIYPDTRTPVLLGLFACARQLLQAYRGCGEAEEDGFTGLFTSTFVSSFVERDAGVTLRRLLATCIVMDMEVIPLASPFAPVTASTSSAPGVPLMEAIPLLLNYGTTVHGATGTWAACCHAAWTTLRHNLYTLLAGGCHENGDDNGGFGKSEVEQRRRQSAISPLALAVACGGSWLFAFRPRTWSRVPPTGMNDADSSQPHEGVPSHADLCEAALEALLASPESLGEALLRDAAWEPWVRLLPWLFFCPEKASHTPSVPELAVCTDWSGTEESGRPHIRDDRVAALVAAHEAAARDASAFLFDGFQL